METQKDIVYQREWRRERWWVRDNVQGLKKEYGDKYIAVKDKQVIDSDEDNFELAKRIQQKYPKEFVLITSIERIINPIENHLPSPETFTKK